MGRDEPSTLDHIAQRGCGKNEPRAVPIRRIRRMHVGDRQSAGIHLGRNFRSAGVLIHRHVRGDWRADVPDGAYDRAEVADPAGPRGGHDPQGVPRARGRPVQGAAGRGRGGVRAQQGACGRQDGGRGAGCDGEGRGGGEGRTQGVDLGARPDRRVCDVVRPGGIPVSCQHFDCCIRHGSAYEAVHRFRIRLFLAQLSDRRTCVRREELEDSAVETFLLLPCGGESGHRLIHVR